MLSWFKRAGTFFSANPWRKAPRGGHLGALRVSQPALEQEPPAGCYHLAEEGVLGYWGQTDLIRADAFDVTLRPS